jgi:hypothetical protein
MTTRPVKLMFEHFDSAGNKISSGVTTVSLKRAQTIRQNYIKHPGGWFVRVAHNGSHNITRYVYKTRYKFIDDTLDFKRESSF